MKNTKRGFSAMLIVALLFALPVSLAEEAAPITVVDGIGREFTFDAPITSAVVYDRYNTEVFRAVGAYDVMVGVDQNAVDTYPEYWAGVGDSIQVVGKNCTDYNLELVVQLHPDAVFMSSLGEYESVTEQLAQFDIPVLIINAWIPDEYYDHIRLVGKVTGREAQGEEFVAFCENMMNTVEERVAAIPESERKTVYFENHGEYKTCLPGSGWHNMIVSAGGINIFGDIVEVDSAKGGTSSYQVDPEFILTADPDVLIENIYSTEVHEALEMFVPLENEELVGELARFVNRPGWDQLTAVKNNQVYGFTSFVGNANSKLIAITYIAKWLYPDTFADLDPDACLKQWLDYMNFGTLEGHTAKLG